MNPLVRAAVAAAVPALLAAAGTAAAAENRWGLVGFYGQASAPRSVGFAESAGLAATLDFPVAGRLSVTAEAWPLLVFHQTKRDRSGRESVPAFALGPLLTFDVEPLGDRWRLRIEGGVSLFWATEPVPDAGTAFNFFDQVGARVLWDLPDGRTASLGYRRLHVSSGGLVGNENPGLSLHTVVLGWQFR